MKRHQIKKLLREVIGLKISSIGKSRIDRAVKQRMSALALTDIQDYAAHLNGNEKEIAALIEEVVVPETWFFRDKAPFSVLAQHVMNKWDKNSPKRQLRLLSIPCSTGEEPYSMAMALMDCGFPRDRFSIDAVDISSRALETAKRACYKEYAFREKGLSLESRYVTQTDQGYLLDETIREKVRFIQDNVLAPCFLNGTGRYNIIFCRNLLIYLNKPAADKVVDTINRLLVRNGILFVGHAETGRISAEKFTPTSYPRSFSFFKKDILLTGCLSESPGIESSGISPGGIPPITRTAKKMPVRTGRIQEKPRRRIKTVPPQKEANLEEAQVLANQGNLEEAASICEAYLREQGPSASAYFLLGVIRDASGDAHLAFDALQKAVYLQPDHYEALLFLALLAERTGQKARAKALKNRVMRVLDQKAENNVPT